MRLSHTSMSQYLRCPQGYKLKYIDGHKELPKWFFNKGSAVHAALEAFYKGKLSTPATLEDMLAASTLRHTKPKNNGRKRTRTARR